MNLFPEHFLGIICGWPGSGKTTLLKNILSTYLYEKFDEIILISPSTREFNSIVLPSDNIITEFNLLLLEKKLDRINKNLETFQNVLIIFDDVISELNETTRRNTILNKLIFNRRHRLDNGMISILITSQKFNMIPTSIRSNLTIFITFLLNDIDCKTIFNEIIRTDSNVFKMICNFTFKNPHDFLFYRNDLNLFFKNFKEIKIEYDYFFYY